MQQKYKDYITDLITIYTNGSTKYKDQCLAIGAKHKLNKNGEAYIKGVKDGFELSIKYLKRIQKEMQKDEKNADKDNGNS